MPAYGAYCQAGSSASKEYATVPQVFRVDFFVFFGVFFCVLSRIFFNAAPRSPKLARM